MWSRAWRQCCNGQKSAHRSHALPCTLVVLATCVFLYGLAAHHNQRLDMSSVKRYALMAGSSVRLHTLSQPVHLMGFCRLASGERQRLGELLKQYSSLPLISYELVDPDRQPALVQRYHVTTYPAVVVRSGPKAIQVSPVDEMAVTSAIVRITRKARPVVYFVTGHGEPALSDTRPHGYSMAKQRLEEQHYRVKVLPLRGVSQVPADAAVVIIAGPRTALLPSEFATLAAYLQRGGRLLLLLDPEMGLGMQPFLQHYGIVLGNNVIIETNALFRLFGGDYHIPAVTTYPPHPITRSLDGLITLFPLVRSVQVASKIPEGVQVQVLALTSAQSWAETDPQAFQGGRAVFDARSDQKGPLSIAVAATRLPQPARNPRGTKQGPTSEQAPVARLVVFGDADFITNSFFPLQGNGTLFLRTVNWLATEERHMVVPSRQRSNVVLTSAEKSLIFWLPVIVWPLVVWTAGTLVLLWRQWRQ